MMLVYSIKKEEYIMEQTNLSVVEINLKDGFIDLKAESQGRYIIITRTEITMTDALGDDVGTDLYGRDVLKLLNMGDKDIVRNLQTLLKRTASNLSNMQVDFEDMSVMMDCQKPFGGVCITRTEIVVIDNSDGCGCDFTGEDALDQLEGADAQAVMDLQKLLNGYTPVMNRNEAVQDLARITLDSFHDSSEIDQLEMFVWGINGYITLTDEELVTEYYNMTDKHIVIVG
jgi:hypothetical protein